MAVIKYRDPVTNEFIPLTGVDGFSPEITVKQDTDNVYILEIKTKDETITTPNLRGASDVSIETLDKHYKIDLELADTPTEGFERTYNLYQSITDEDEHTEKTLVGSIDIPSGGKTPWGELQDDGSIEYD